MGDWEWRGGIVKDRNRKGTGGRKREWMTSNRKGRRGSLMWRRGSPMWI